MWPNILHRFAALLHCAEAVGLDKTKKREQQNTQIMIWTLQQLCSGEKTQKSGAHSRGSLYSAKNVDYWGKTKKKNQKEKKERKKNQWLGVCVFLFSSTWINSLLYDNIPHRYVPVCLLKDFTPHIRGSSEKSTSGFQWQLVLNSQDFQTKCDRPSTEQKIS